MLTQAVIRQYAVGQRIDTEVADQEIVLHYALALLHGAGLTGRRDSRIGSLLFKGGTALRKCIFGSTGRFSQDIDFDAVEQNGFESEVKEHLAMPTHTSRFVSRLMISATRRMATSAQASATSIQSAAAASNSRLVTGARAFLSRAL